MYIQCIISCCRSLALDNDKTMVQKTEIKKKNPNPEFNQEIKFKVPPENGHAVVARGSLHISVFHKDALGQQLIGECKLIESALT